MRRQLLFAALGCVVVGLTACGELLTSPGADEPGAGTGAVADSPDAGAATDVGASVGDAAGARDDGAVEAGCTEINEDFEAGSDPARRWGPLGSARFRPGAVELTQLGEGPEAGAIWWGQPISFGVSLRVEIDFAIESDGLPGEGIAIAWANEPGLGQPNQNFGICSAGLDGTAVAVDSVDSHLHVMSGISEICQTNGGVTDVSIDTSGTLRLEVDGPSVKGTFGEIDRSRNLTPPRTGYVGITASTSAARTSRYSVTRVRVRVCN